VGKQQNTEDERPNQPSGHQVEIEGDISGQVAVGEDIRQIQNVYIQSPPPAPTSLHQLPTPPADFTGRTTELEELQAALEEHRGAAICGLRGLGGIGKTALALKLAEELAPRHPDAQFFLDLKGTTEPLTPGEAMAHVIRAYHPTAKLPESEGELAGLYHSVLHGERALLLMDNAADADQVAPLIPPAGCLLLVTSRRHFTLPGLVAHNLEALPPEDAQVLLLRIAPRIGAECAEEMARLCGYLPLALRLAASALAERVDLESAEYLARLTETQTRLGLVEASLDLSYALLAPELQRLWRSLAVFPTTFDRLATAAVWGLEIEPAGEALSDLVRYSLATWDAAARRYHLHDLARLFAEARLEPKEWATAARRHAAHYERLARAARDLYLQGGKTLLRGLALFDLEWDNIQAGQTWAARHAEAYEAAANLCNVYPDAASYILELRQHPEERIEWLTAAAAAARHLGDREAEGVHLGNLGLAYRHLGQVEQAIEYHEQSLVIAREIGDRYGEGADLGNLGLAYSALGQVERAIEYYQEALVIAREICAASTQGSLEWAIARRGEGSIAGNLGLAYSDLGQVERATEYYWQALVIAREIGDRQNAGNQLGNLGNAYSDLGQVERAIEYYQEALVIAREIGGRRNEGIWLGNLGTAYHSLGQMERAIESYEAALVIARKIGDRHGEGAQLGNLGNAYHALGQVEQAIEYHEQALGISREIGDRRNEGNQLGSLGNAYYSLGQVERAIEYFKETLVIAREIGDRRNEGNELGSLGNAYYSLGQVERAIESYEAALGIAREIGDRRGEGNRLGNLGNAYGALGQVERAIESYEAALVIAREIGDRRNEGNMLGNLGTAYSELGQVERAIEYLKEALGISREIGDRHGEGVNLGNLGAVYSELGQVERAIEYHEQALVIAREIGDRFGEAIRLCNLGEDHRDLGQVMQARQYFIQSLSIFEEIKLPNAQQVRDLLAELEEEGR
jgi:tetratricopeptide (TPR) repeat protein